MRRGVAAFMAHSLEGTQLATTTQWGPWRAGSRPPSSPAETSGQGRREPLLPSLAACAE